MSGAVNLSMVLEGLRKSIFSFWRTGILQLYPEPVYAKIEITKS